VPYAPSFAKAAEGSLRQSSGLPAEALATTNVVGPSFAKATEGSLRQSSGLPAEALAKAGGGGGNRTRVRKCFHMSVYVRSLSFGDSPGRNASDMLSGFARRRNTLTGSSPPPGLRPARLRPDSASRRSRRGRAAYLGRKCEVVVRS